MITTFIWASFFSHHSPVCWVHGDACLPLDLSGSCVQRKEELNRLCLERMEGGKETTASALSPLHISNLWHITTTLFAKSNGLPFLFRQAVCELCCRIHGWFRLVVKDSGWKYFCDYQLKRLRQIWIRMLHQALCLSQLPWNRLTTPAILCSWRHGI